MLSSSRAVSKKTVGVYFSRSSSSGRGINKASIFETCLTILTKQYSFSAIGLLKVIIAYALMRLGITKIWPRKSLKNKLVLITGGGAGIGQKLALEFAKQGCKLVLWDLNQAGLHETQTLVEAAYPNTEVHTQIADVSSKEAVFAAADVVKAEVGRVWCVVNNAGIVRGKPLLDEQDSVVKTFEVNSMSLFWTVKAFLPDMIAARAGGEGHIVTMASMCGYFSAPSLVDYSASKFAARGFAEGLRAELTKLGASGVGTSLICPGHVKTAMFQGFSGSSLLVPSLTPEGVAAKTVDAVRTGTSQVVLPSTCNLAIILQALLPPPWMDLLTSLTSNTNDAMNNFQGGANVKRALDSMSGGGRRGGGGGGAASGSVNCLS